MKKRYGNLVREMQAGAYDVIMHGCNCQNMMGAGIAKTIRDVWPGVYDADTKAHREGRAKLGNVSIYRMDDAKFILNCYTQLEPGRMRRMVDYEAVAKCFEIVVKMVGVYKKSLRIGMPLIGCGLAGGSWKIVGAIAEEYFKGYDLTVVEYPSYAEGILLADKGDINVNGNEVLYSMYGHVKKFREDDQD